MKKIFLLVILMTFYFQGKTQSEIIYQSDTLQYTSDKSVERKPCKIVFKYYADKLTEVVIKYNDKKIKDWSFIVIKKMHYHWNCDEYHAQSGGMNFMIGICGEGKDLKKLSFIICTGEGAENNDCMKYINLKTVDK